MKLTYWLLLSFLVHFALGFYFIKNQGNPAQVADEVYLDLTVVPSLAGESESSATPVRINTPAKSVAALVPSASAINVAESASASVDGSGETDGNSEGSTLGGADGQGTAAWSDVTRFPKVKKEVKAVYPEEGKKARIDGPVVLEVLIDKVGKVQHVNIIRGQGYGLDEAAVSALRAFEFQPAFKGNEPVAVKIHYTYRFKLGIN